MNEKEVGKELPTSFSVYRSNVYLLLQDLLIVGCFIFNFFTNDNNPFEQVFFQLFFIAGCLGCKFRQTVNIPIVSQQPIFTLLSPQSTNVHFSNTLTEGLNTNVLMYQYFYNGGGVAIADVNNDGLQDIYFSGNMVDNKLFLNKGSMQFLDITEAAGVAGRGESWKTGVTMADVNGDGLTDICVSYSGTMPNEKRVNQLFINEGIDKKGIPKFTDKIKEFGLADFSFTTQMYFFDFDKDADLDMLCLNENPDDLTGLDESGIYKVLREENKLVGIRMFKNSNNHFTDITKAANISSTMLTYGLGAGIADINSDGWLDIYISSDFNAPDYLYINNKNGSFTDKLQSSVGHISQASMGNYVGDINNDLLPDIYTLDMLPEDNHRQKMLVGADNYEKFQTILRQGFYYQYMRNMLQLNNGDGTFSEIGQLSGISNTDWSWAPLFADFDNDGWKDLYVTNGFLRDFTDKDFLKFMSDYVQSKGHLNRADVLDILKEMPASDVKNYIYKNNGNLSFTNMGKQWGIDIPSNSNGAAYADLDNDGDLDLVVNNNNKPAFIYRNESDKNTANHFITIKLKGAGKNTDGLGAKVYIYSKSKNQLQEQMPARGYQSSVSPMLHFGLGSEATIDSLRIVWLSGKQQVLQNIKTSQLLTLNEKDAITNFEFESQAKPIFKEITSPINFTHATITINDFKRQTQLCNPLSFSGPCTAKADVNADGLEDLYIGGGNWQAASLYIQQQGAQFVQKLQPAFEADMASEDADAEFFDANNDGFIDLYVVSGGYHNYSSKDELLQDRLYLNDGKGNFTKSKDALPPMKVSKSCVAAADINGDGFTDLFIGGRVVPGNYPETPASYLLLNDGKGHFTDKTEAMAPTLQKAGMISDASWTDLNNDKKVDLIVLGEWMPVSVFINVNGKLKNKTSDYFDKEYSGWWNKLLIADLNNDGKQDIVAGNLGLNSQCKVSDKEPAELYYKDFDDNGTIDPFLCFYQMGESHPYITRDELLDQIIAMRPIYPNYKSFADAKINNIFTKEELKNVEKVTANHFATSYFERGSDGKFHLRELPIEAQFAPVFTINAFDYNADGKQDLLLCGNMNGARLRFGKYDANYGVLLRNDGSGKFTYISQPESGFQLKGDIRSVLSINNNLLFGINQQSIKTYKQVKL